MEPDLEFRWTLIGVDVDDIQVTGDSPLIGASSPMKKIVKLVTCVAIVLLVSATGRPWLSSP